MGLWEKTAHHERATKMPSHPTNFPFGKRSPPEEIESQRRRRLNPSLYKVKSESKGGEAEEATMRK